MPDLGKYAIAVLGSYGVSIGLLALLIGVSLWQNARARARLAALEARRRKDG